MHSSILTDLVPDTSTIPASDQQAHGWDLRSSGRGGSLSLALRLVGALDLPRLRRAFIDVMTRHEILRTAWAGALAADGAVETRRLSTGDIAAAFSVCDVTRLPARAQGRVHRGGRHRRSAVGGLLHALVLRDTAADHEFMLTCSPVAGDAVTLRQVAREMLDAYAGRPGGEALAYADVCGWQRELLDEEEDAEAGRRYWRHVRADAAEPERLPFERDHPAAPAAGVARGVVHVDLTDAAAIARSLVAAHRSAAAFWLLCWQALFHRLSGGTPVVVGATIDGRPYDELREVIGPLDRTLPVSSTLRGRDRIGDACAALEGVLQAHADWQAYDVRDRATGRAGDRLGFACVRWVTSWNDAAPRVDSTNAAVDTTGAALALVVHEHADRWEAALHYDRASFEPAVVARVGRWLTSFARAAAARLDATLDTCSLLTADERAEMIGRWNATAHAWPDERRTTLVSWLDAQAARTPDAAAVWSEEGRWTYAELHAHANQIARRLQRLGVGAESRVGVWLTRSRLYVAAFVGILKAGASYVPLDPAYPAARLAFQASDAQVAVILTEQSSASAIPDGAHVIEVLDADAAAWRAESAAAVTTTIWPDQLAYTIYTSGSTGQPKGAMNSHRAIVNRLRWMQAAYALTPRDRVLQKTSCSFDVSVWELFWPLGTGAMLVLAKPGGQQDPAYLADVIARAGVTTAHFVPAMLDAFVTAGGLAACGGVRLIVCSGEALPGPLAARCVTAWSGRLENLYGPTEAAVDVTWHSCARETLDDATVPIGRPIANTRMRVQDAAGQPAPVGVIGELFIGGVQVGRGYWNRPDLTAARFLPDAAGPTPGERVYRTGDLARVRADGVLEYVGRIDHQIKLRGNRIELGEIEAVLRQQPGIRDAVVLLREDAPGDKRLVAYLVAAGARPAIDALQEPLRARLPEYMVPAVLVVLDAFPLTPNGKIDRRQLPAPAGERPTLQQTYAAPRTPVEATLAGIWRDVLRLDRVGVHDNFFALGGDSILSLQIVARARQAGLWLAPRQVFEQQTVAALAMVAKEAAGPQAEQGLVTGPVPLMPIQHWFFSHEHPAVQYDNQSVRLEIADEGLPALEPAWNALLRHHDALRFRYERTADGWTQYAVGVDEGDREIVPSIDLRAVRPEAQARVQEQVGGAVQASLDLARGPIARAVVLRTDAPAPHVIFAIHHLAIDGVSWRVLLSDLEMACRQWHTDQALALPPKTTSVRAWTEALHRLAASETLAAELSIWTEMSAPSGVLPRDVADGVNVGRSARSTQIAMTRDDTQALLQELPARGAGQMLDFLLAALVQALDAWAGEPRWRIDLESHGREGGPDDIDVSRTVGWFTALYPVRFAAERDPLATLRAVKTTLRRVPQQGVGYGVLRYFDVPGAEVVRAAPRAEILFNYLGQVDQVLAPAGWLRPAGGTTGRARHRDAPRDHVLEIVSVVAGGQLRMTWTYSEHLHTAARIARLAEQFQEALRELIARGRTAREADILVPSDFRHVALDDSDMGRIAQLFDDEDDDNALPGAR